MPKIYVHTPFTLQHKGEKHQFPVGNHQVPAEIAQHWYAQAHIGAEPAADPDSGAAADAMLADLEAKEKALVARADDLDAYAQALAGREALVAESEGAAHARQAALDDREKAIAEREQATQNGGPDAAAKDAGKPSGSGKAPSK